MGAASKNTVFKFKAFISYSHKDEAHARRLHKRLEKYRLPKAISSVHKSLRPIFRDRDDLAASAGLNQSIRDALTASENLIVICSPHAAQSQWVEEEILFFKSLGRADRVFSIIVDGVPNASDSPEIAAQECFPKAIKFKTGADGHPNNTPAEPLAADIRPSGDGEKLGVLKLISGLLDLSLDELVRRDLQSGRRKLMGVIATSAMVTTCLAALTWTAHTARTEAEARKADAEDFVEFLLSDLSGQLEAYGRLDLLQAVGDQAVDYYEQFEDGAFDAKANGRRARTLQFTGELQDSLGETDISDVYFIRAYAITKDNLAKDTTDPERLFEHARSAYVRSLPLRKTKQFQQELVFLTEYETLAQTLLTQSPKSSRAISQLAHAKMNMGRIAFRMKDVQIGRAQLNAAKALYASLPNEKMDIQTRLDSAENLAWLAVTYGVSGDPKTAYGLRREQAETLSIQHALTPDDFRVSEGLIYARLGLGNAARYVKKYDEAIAVHSSVFMEADKALRLEPGREKMMRAQVAALEGLMHTALAQRDFSEFKRVRAQIEALRSRPMPEVVRKNLFWNSSFPAALQRLDAAYEAAIKPDNP